MIRNYIKTAYRTLIKNKGFTAINVLGLSVGLAACLLIIFYVVDELSYDRYNTKAGRIYRINEDLKLGNNSVLYAVCMPPLAKTLKSDFPEVEDAVRIKNAGTFHIKKNNETIIENRIAFADPSIFNVFTLPMISGVPAMALIEPNSVVLTESSAKKYFNSTDVVGKTLKVDDNKLLNITGVIKDIPTQSHFNFDFFISMSTFPDSKSDKWLRSDYNTYILFKKGTDPQKFEAKFPAFLVKYSSGEMQSDLHMSVDAFEKNGNFFRLNLTPLTDIHLHSARIGELGPNGTMQYIYIFSAIALFILVIACINFMNLSTASYSGRAREVGVRKVLGSPRKYLVFQFLTESVLVTLVSTIIAFTVALLLLPAFDQLSGKTLIINTQTLTWLLPLSFFIVILVGCIAGSYPAFFLSSFRPVNVLKGSLATGFKGSKLRSVLVVFQFFISIVLITGTLVVHSQLNFIRNKDLGYNRNQVLVIKQTYELGDQAKIFKQQVKQLPGVINATLTGFTPTSMSRTMHIFYKDASLEQSKAIFPQQWSVDEDYISTLGMKLTAGRNFSRQMSTDSTGLIINESAAKFLELKDPLNKTLLSNEDGKREHVKPFHIIGVVKDFNFESMHQSIAPMILILNNDNGNLSIKVSTTNLPALISAIKTKWEGLTPVHFEYSFMDQDFDAIYRAEQRIGTIFMIFTILAILIACLGLFGLAAYAAEQRTKEIGIRKILGASVSAIVGTLSKDFIKLVFIAVAVATPVAWWAMNKWLQDFAYRINIQWWMLAIAGLAAVLIAVITISFQSIKAAIANPVKSLRSE